VRLAIPLRGAVVVVVVFLGVAVAAGLDTGDPACGVAEPDPRADPATDPTAELTPAAAEEIAPAAAGTRLVTDDADPDAAAAAAAVRDSRLDAPEATGSSNSWGSSDWAGAANPPPGAADFVAPESRALPEESRLRPAPATVPAPAELELPP
jgi:hypothetical protein